jgi:hypothetical protein
MNIRSLFRGVRGQLQKPTSAVDQVLVFGERNRARASESESERASERASERERGRARERE